MSVVIVLATETVIPLTDAEQVDPDAHVSRCQVFHEARQYSILRFGQSSTAQDHSISDNS